MPLFLILGPIFGLAAIVALVAHGHKGPATSQAKAAPPQNTQQIELDHGMPEVVVHQVLNALVHDQDPGQLEALAHELGAKYPISASELHAKAAALRGAKSEGPASPALPTSEAAPAAANPDTSEPAKILQAAMRAYAQESDPVSLDGFAQSIRDRYPMAALMLGERAQEIRTALAQVAPAGAAATPQTPPSASLPAAPAANQTPASVGVAHVPFASSSSTVANVHASPRSPLTSAVLPDVVGTGAGPSAGQPGLASASPQAKPSTYVVQPGDSASVIAEKLTHDGKRWPELVAANVIKPTTPDGNFASLRAGETLMLPSSWGGAQTQHVQSLLSLSGEAHP